MERNLYLTIQLLELEIPVVIAMNMTDILEKRKEIINYKKFEEELNTPVCAISANKKTGIKNLLEQSVNLIESKNFKKFKSIYSEDINLVINNINNFLKDKVKFSRWTAVKIFEDDKIAEKKIKLSLNLKNKIKEYKSFIKLEKNMDRQIIIADEKYK